MPGYYSVERGAVFHSKINQRSAGTDSDPFQFLGDGLASVIERFFGRPRVTRDEHQRMLVDKSGESVVINPQERDGDVFCVHRFDGPGAEPTATHAAHDNIPGVFIVLRDFDLRSIL